MEFSNIIAYNIDRKDQGTQVSQKDMKDGHIFCCRSTSKHEKKIQQANYEIKIVRSERWWLHIDFSKV